MNLKQKFRKNQGITLIALVVTIIYIIAVLVSLILCDKLSDFKNSNNNQIRIINF